MISKRTLAAIAIILIPVGVLAALLQAADDPPTELYVRTTPAGATLFLDGKPLGTAPNVFEVAPGKHELLAVLDGYKSAKREIDVPATRIERVILTLESLSPVPNTNTKTSGTPPEPKPRITEPLSFGPVVERVVNDHGVGKDYLIDLDTGKLYTRPENFRNLNLDKLHAWGRRVGIDASGVLASEGVLTGFEIRAAIVDDASWEEVPPQAVREALKQPDPRLVVRRGELFPPSIRLGGKGVSPERVYAFQTREGGVGVLQIVGLGDKDRRSVKIRYKLVSGTSASAAADPVWTCAMHPQVNVPKPGKCPTCAMDLVARPPRSAAEQAVREVISNFVEAVTRNDRASVAKFLSKRSHLVHEHTREIMSEGIKVAEISFVIVAHGRALAITDFAQVPDPESKKVMCVVYTVVKQGDRWVIEDIDLATANGLSDEISDLQAEPDPDESTQPSKKVHLPDASSTSETPDQILRRYAQAVWAELPGKLREAGPGDWSEIVADVTSKLTARHIMPHADSLAAHLLGQLPEADPVDMSQWTERPLKAVSTKTKDLPKAHPSMAWNPVALANAMRYALARDELSAKAILGAMAPPASVAWDNSVDKPVIATPMGNELFVVHLERGAGGQYVCRNLQRFERKPSKASQVHSTLPANASPFQKLMQAYSDAVWRQLTPTMNAQGFEQIKQESHQLAEKHFKGHEDVLRQEAQRILAELPKAEAIDRSLWVSRLSESERQDVASVRSELLKATASLRYMPQLWNPVHVARTARSWCIHRSESPEALGIREMTATAAKYSLETAADADPEHPVIVQRLGDEITIVHLRRTSLGTYELKDFEWLVRADGARGPRGL